MSRISAKYNDIGDGRYSWAVPARGKPKMFCYLPTW